jgi:hypothetical protein
MNIILKNTLAVFLLRVFIVCFATWSHSTLAQENWCGSQLDSCKKKRQQLSLTMSQLLQKPEGDRLSPEDINATEFLEVPVIIHIIHRGEPLGTGTNLSAARVYSQIEALNRDFSRSHADTVHTPEVFKTLVANPSIRFVLAKYTPDGLPLEEAGIHRYNGRRTDWSRQDFNRLIKPVSIWKPEYYYNIWVAPLQEGLLGYAQFPEVSGFNQPPDLAESPFTDGVVIASHVFGTKQFGDEVQIDSRFNKGRTLTHETGHFLGLIHIWGDGGCELDDLCDDTPPAERPSRGCPQEQASCNSPDMVQNFMDLSVDSCMNLFTICQVERMRTILQNAPRRASLLQSDVARPVQPGAYAAFKLQNHTICINEVLQPENLSRLIGDSTQLAFNWEFPGAFPENSMLANPSVSYAEAGKFPIVLNIKYADSLLTVKDSIEVKASPLTQMPASIFWSHGTLPASWSVQGAGWETRQLSGKSVLAASNFQPGQDRQSYLVLPPANTQNTAFLVVQLELAYALRASRSDALAIYRGSGCNSPSILEAIIDNEALRTTPSVMFPFIPKEHEWETRQFYIATQGEASIQIAIANINNAANTLYIRNIKLFSIKEIPAPDARFRIEPSLALPHEKVEVSALSPFPFRYEWQFTNGTPSSGIGNTFTITYKQPGSFPVKLRTSLAQSLVKQVKSLQVLKGQLLGNTSAEAPFSLPESGWGSLGGHSDAGDIAKAERFSSTGLHDSLWAIDLYPTVLQASDTISHITVAIWEGNQRPERKLTQVEVNFTAMRTAWKEQKAFRVLLASPIKAPASFFAGFQLNYIQPDTFAVGVYPAELNSAWEQSPTGIWRPLSLPQTEGGKGRSVSLGIKVLSTSSQTELPAREQIQIYPNPTSGEIRLLTPPESLFLADGIVLYSAHGQVVWQQDFPAAREVHIILPPLPNGFYIAQIRSKLNFLCHKLIVQY